MKVKKNVEVFNQDVLQGQGYQYTDQARLSSRIANERMTQGIKEATDWQGKCVLDIGCGDGVYSYTLVQMGAASVLGLDPANRAIDKAKENYGGITNLFFAVGNIYELDDLEKKFDIAVIRGVLHHLPDAAAALKMVARVADEVIILEPNGANPVLKVIEKLSQYHRLHEEQSFFPSTLMQWCTDAGLKTTNSQFINLVPFFCPSVLVYVLKLLEPLVEKLPILRNIACGQIVIKTTIFSST